VGLLRMNLKVVEDRSKDYEEYLRIADEKN
jgi:hypothetical protein